jgi:protein-S-isoprenylcysteine O-methyltransferase Ste14
LLDGYRPALTERFHFWTIDHDAMRRLGVVGFAIGGTLWLWPVFVLGRRFSGSVAIQPGASTTGVYRFIRHPS